MFTLLVPQQVIASVASVARGEEREVQGSEQWMGPAETNA